MNDQTDIYFAQILPLIEQIQTIATEHSIPLIVVAQISDGDFKASLNIPKHAHRQMKESARWWLQDSKF